MTTHRGYGSINDKPEETPITVQPYLNLNSRVKIIIYIELESNPNFDDYIGFSNKALEYLGDDKLRIFNVAKEARRKLFIKLAEHVEEIQDGTDYPKHTIYTETIPQSSVTAVSHMQMIRERLVIFIAIVHRLEVAPLKQDFLEQEVPRLH